MSLYTFFPCQSDGVAQSFETFELVNDTEAYERAAALLRQHPSAAYVAVWCGERKVCITPRAGISAEAATSRRHPGREP